jgi:hypothetical protein
MTGTGKECVPVIPLIWFGNKRVRLDFGLDAFRGAWID